MADRAGEAISDRTARPARSPPVCGSCPNRRVNGTDLEIMGIESIWCSVASMGYAEKKISAISSG
jgi:hypothetical protein